MEFQKDPMHTKVSPFRPPLLEQNFQAKDRNGEALMRDANGFFKWRTLQGAYGKHSCLLEEKRT